MKYYETKIGRIIEKEFDSRMGNAVISYIMDKGMSNVSVINMLIYFLTINWIKQYLKQDKSV